MKNKTLKILSALLLVSLGLFLLSAAVFAAGNDPAGAVEESWKETLSQIRKVTDNVIFPLIDVVLGILFFVKVATTYLDYRKRGQVDLTQPVILFLSLVFSLTAPAYLWALLGL